MDALKSLFYSPLLLKWFTSVSAQERRQNKGRTGNWRCQKTTEFPLEMGASSALTRHFQKKQWPSLCTDGREDEETEEITFWMSKQKEPQKRRRALCSSEPQQEFPKSKCSSSHIYHLHRLKSVFPSGRRIIIIIHIFPAGTRRWNISIRNSRRPDT